MKSADEITANDILEAFHRTTKPTRRSTAAERALKGHKGGKWLMEMQMLGGASALEIICRLLDWCVAQDESLTLGDVLDGKGGQERGHREQR